MKFTKLSIALAVASTLTACGGGGGGSTAGPIAGITPNPVVVPPSVVQQDLGELYVNDLGGPININFTPTTLPTWIKSVNGKYQVDTSDCNNRFTELSNTQNKITVVQTSKFQCTLGDFNSASNINFNEGSGSLIGWGTTGPAEQRFFSPTIINRSISKVDGSTWPKKRGGDQLMVEVHKGDCTGTDCTRTDGARDRAEISYSYELETINGLWYPNFNRDYWINFSFYVPKPYKEQGAQDETSQVTTFFQIMTSFKDKDNNFKYYPALMIGKGYNGPVSARFFPTVSIFTSVNKVLIDDDNFEGHWHDITIKYSAWVTDEALTTDDEPRCYPNCLKKAPFNTVEIYVNGIKKVEYKNRTLLTADSNINLKFGLYRPTSAENITQNIYFDEIRLGKNREEVDLK